MEHLAHIPFPEATEAVLKACTSTRASRKQQRENEAYDESEIERAENTMEAEHEQPVKMAIRASSSAKSKRVIKPSGKKGKKFTAPVILSDSISLFLIIRAPCWI